MTNAPTPEHLTEVLRRAGELRHGRVAEVSVETSRTTIVSTISRLRLSYEGDPGGSPVRVFQKTPRKDVAAEFSESGCKEAAFYATVAPALPARVVPRCFEAVWEPDGGRRHLLLEDLTDSHVAVSDWPVAPTLEQCERIVDAYARFHAFWWDEPRLGVSVGTFLDDAGFERFMHDFARRFASFAGRVGDRLSAERKELYDRFLRAAPRLLARYRSHEDLTIVHGDAHVWNLLYPRDPASERVRLIDWEGWRVDTATDDLAYMMAVHWYPERRRRFETALLRRYHAALTEHGVRGYGFEALRDDYRLSALWQITTPVWQATANLGAWIWWSHLERVMLAVDDLDCRALLD